MSTNRQLRSESHRRRPLRPDLALVPLSFRADHPEFPSPITEEDPETEMPGEAEIPGEQSPLDLVEGQRTLLRIAVIDDSVFQDTLSCLLEATGHAFIRPSEMQAPQPKPTEPKTKPTPPDLQDVVPTVNDGLSDLPTPAAQGLIMVGLKLDEVTQETQVIVADIPILVWASELLNLVITKSQRISTILARKWTPERTWVATSRAAFPIDNTRYNNWEAGFREIGYYNAIMGNAYSAHGPKDSILSEAIRPVDGLNELKQLYQVPASAEVYAIYLFYHDEASYAAGLVAGEFSPVRPKVKKETTLPKTIRNSATSPSDVIEIDSDSELTSSPLAQSYVRQHAPELVKGYQIITSTTAYQSGYKVMAGVRMVREIANKLGIAWPSKGLPKTLTVLRVVDLLRQQNPQGIPEADRGLYNAIGYAIHYAIHDPGKPIPAVYKPTTELSFEDIKKFCQEVLARPGFAVHKKK
ncbi:hypothetical protein DFH07DRAFT_950059 [Mycena maculata]|uniref:Uncharacterized protein n=1 Tax=Mycena maculata TaxID=230809 RepID=A0AAD7NYQ5_9AGAR|nr:hypothetical protein DFH07DRAFT_950059 [Mycena maculata]